MSQKRKAKKIELANPVRYMIYLVLAIRAIATNMIKMRGHIFCWNALSRDLADSLTFALNLIHIHTITTPGSPSNAANIFVLMKRLEKS